MRAAPRSHSAAHAGWTAHWPLCSHSRSVSLLRRCCSGHGQTACAAACFISLVWCTFSRQRARHCSGIQRSGPEQPVRPASVAMGRSPDFWHFPGWGRVGSAVYCPRQCRRFVVWSVCYVSTQFLSHSSSQPRRPFSGVILFIGFAGEAQGCVLPEMSLPCPSASPVWPDCTVVGG